MESHSRKRVQVQPNSSIAFDILFRFCAGNGLEDEFAIGLMMILMLTSRDAPSPILAAPIVIPEHTHSRRLRDVISERVIGSIDKCLFLSSTQDGLDSLLCSAFFNPCVPCNLVGAESMGIKDALLSFKDDLRGLLAAIRNRMPYLAPLWAAVVCIGQARRYLRLVLDGLPPICLPVAFWTNTFQSFLQITYHSTNPTETSIPRASEFQTSYFSRSEAGLPWTPSPPFGSSSISNLSLEVRDHHEHQHRPRAWRLHWILRSGEKIPAGQKVPLNAPVLSIVNPENTSQGGEQLQ
jgi:hypothetical protein